MVTYKKGLLLPVYCGVSPVLTDGNGSGVGTGVVISGKLYKTDGVTPAPGAIVTIRPKNKTAPLVWDSSNASSGSSQTTLTDGNGVFSFSTVDPGLYVIEGADNDDNMALFDSIVIDTPAKPITVLTDTLRPSGAIKGSVMLVNSGSYSQMFVLALGVNRFSQVNSDGTFLFTPLAQSTYTLKIVSLDPQYGSVDTGNSYSPKNLLLWSGSGRA